MILSRVNGSVTPLRLPTIKMTVSWVVNRRPHSGHDLRRRIAVPSSAVLLSMTRLSGWRQKGQCTRDHLPGRRLCSPPSLPENTTCGKNTTV
jgi:hypothetical protein